MAKTVVGGRDVSSGGSGNGAMAMSIPIVPDVVIEAVVPKKKHGATKKNTLFRSILLVVFFLGNSHRGQFHKPTNNKKRSFFHPQQIAPTTNSGPL